MTRFSLAAAIALAPLGRRPEGYEPLEHVAPQDARHVDGYFNEPTDVGWARTTTSRSLRRRTARTPGAVRMGTKRSRKATLGGRQATEKTDA